MQVRTYSYLLIQALIYSCAYAGNDLETENSERDEQQYHSPETTSPSNSVYTDDHSSMDIDEPSHLQLDQLPRELQDLIFLELPKTDLRNVAQTSQQMQHNIVQLSPIIAAWLYFLPAYYGKSNKYQQRICNFYSDLIGKLKHFDFEDDLATANLAKQQWIGQAKIWELWLENRSLLKGAHSLSMPTGFITDAVPREFLTALFDFSAFENIASLSIHYPFERTGKVSSYRTRDPIVLVLPYSSKKLRKISLMGLSLCPAIKIKWQLALDKNGGYLEELILKEMRADVIDLRPYLQLRRVTLTNIRPSDHPRSGFRFYPPASLRYLKIEDSPMVDLNLVDAVELQTLEMINVKTNIASFPLAPNLVSVTMKNMYQSLDFRSQTQLRYLHLDFLAAKRLSAVKEIYLSAIVKHLTIKNLLLKQVKWPEGAALECMHSSLTHLYIDRISVDRTPWIDFRPFINIVSFKLANSRCANTLPAYLPPQLETLDLTNYQHRDTPVEKKFVLTDSWHSLCEKVMHLKVSGNMDLQKTLLRLKAAHQPEFLRLLTLEMDLVKLKKSFARYKDFFASLPIGLQTLRIVNDFKAFHMRRLLDHSSFGLFIDDLVALVKRCPNLTVEANDLILADLHRKVESEDLFANAGSS